MREINECTAEVFRRSEKRIKERRKTRNRILALCVPLCLIVTVWSVMILPAMLPARESNDSAAEGFAGNNVGSIVCSYVMVEIQDGGMFLENYNPENYNKITDKVEITRIFSALHSLFPVKDDAVPEGMVPDQDAAEDGNGSTDSASRHSDYVITFSDAEGNKTVYNLKGKELVNVRTNETVTLTDDQAEELKTALGLTK